MSGVITAGEIISSGSMSCRAGGAASRKYSVDVID
jgi:hypothetical protein